MALFFSVRSIAKSITTRDIFYEGSSRARVRRKTSSFGWTVVSSIKIIIKINPRDRRLPSFFFRNRVLGFGDKTRRTFSSSFWSSRRTFRGPRRFFRVSSGSSPSIQSAADDDDLKVVTLLRLGLLSSEEDVNAARLGGWRRRWRGRVVFVLATIARATLLCGCRSEDSMMMMMMMMRCIFKHAKKGETRVNESE